VSPGAEFIDVLNADLAGNRQGLSLAVVGEVRGKPVGSRVVRVYTRGRTSRWRRTPGFERLLAAGNPVSITEQGRCVGFESEPRGRVLACLRDGEWRRVASAGLPPRPARLLKLSRFDGGLWAVFKARDQVTVLRLRNGRWHRVGKALRTGRAIAAVGESAGARGVVDVALADVASGERVLWTLVRGHWTRHAPLRGTGGGPMPGGPVRLGSRIYLPVIDAFVEPWKLSVRVLEHRSWSPAAGPLNRGLGNAQGVVSAAGSGIWASWQENAPRDDGLFDTHIYAQQVAPEAGAARELWAGTSIGPGSVETVRAVGRLWELYMPAAKRRKALGVAVVALR
jgi:hypothetical protein